MLLMIQYEVLSAKVQNGLSNIYSGKWEMAPVSVAGALNVSRVDELVERIHASVSLSPTRVQ